MSRGQGSDPLPPHYIEASPSRGRGGSILFSVNGVTADRSAVLNRLCL